MEGLTPHEIDLAAANGGQTASLVTQLHGLIRLLQTHTDLPVSEFTSTYVQFNATSAAEVDAAAIALGVNTQWSEDRTHYEAEYSIGPNVAYRVIYFVPGHIEAWTEHSAAFRPAQVKGLAA